MALPICSFNFRLLRKFQTTRNAIPITIMMREINKPTNIFLSVVVSPIEDNQIKNYYHIIYLNVNS